MFRRDKAKRSSINDVTQFWPFFDPSPLIVMLFYWGLIAILQNPWTPLDCDVIYGRPQRNIPVPCVDMQVITAQANLSFGDTWKNQSTNPLKQKTHIGGGARPGGAKNYVSWIEIYFIRFLWSMGQHTNDNQMCEFPNSRYCGFKNSFIKSFLVSFTKYKFCLLLNLKIFFISKNWQILV